MTDLSPSATRAETPLLEPDLLAELMEGAVVDFLEVDAEKVPRYTREYWTSRQRQGHSLHEISYRACFKPQLPRFFIERLTRPGDCVFDPFMGRGTTILEAALLNRRVIGNDVNPLSRILTEPRLSLPLPKEIKARLEEIPWDLKARADRNLSMFYSPATEARIVSLRRYLMKRKKAGTEDAVDRWVRMVATNRLTGHSPGFFSVYTLPPNQAVSAESQRKINADRRQTPSDRDVEAILVRKSRQLMRSLHGAQREELSAVAGSARFTEDDATALRGIPDGSADLVVTSPPFLDVVQYAKDNWLRCWFNGIDVERVAGRIRIESSIEGWSSFMRDGFRELHRVVKPGGWIAFEVGEIRKGKVRLDEVVLPLGRMEGLRCVAVLVNGQQFTKTSNCWGVKNNRLGTNSNRIVLFRKDKQARPEPGDGTS